MDDPLESHPIQHHILDIMASVKTCQVRFLEPEVEYILYVGRQIIPRILRIMMMIIIVIIIFTLKNMNENRNDEDEDDDNSVNYNNNKKTKINNNRNNIMPLRKTPSCMELIRWLKRLFSPLVST